MNQNINVKILKHNATHIKIHENSTHHTQITTLSKLQPKILDEPKY
jgi:hypothetical protein